MRAFLTWLVPAGVVALAVARVSVWVQPHFAPVVLYPLLVGAALGALLCGLLQVARLGGARLAVMGTVLVALAAAAYLWLRTSLPDLDGTVAVAGADGPIGVVRDANAIPHVFASTERDAFFGLFWMSVTIGLLQPSAALVGVLLVQRWVARRPGGALGEAAPVG